MPELREYRQGNQLLKLSHNLQEADLLKRYAHIFPKKKTALL
jgi:hypothetical protein